ncbi:MAG: DNA-directed RNA polymerase subunit alpha [Patescibacteria group bacterium]|nr:DNA-directed RNA polymerase subunit alpha [Patescibacteria group bacterium]
MEKIPLPNKIEYKEVKKNQTQISIEPLFPGYGITIANPLRRVLLSSLTGAAITKIKIKGIKQEFSSLPYLKEDIVDFILNIKKIRIKMFQDEPIILTLKTKGEKELTAGDISKNAQAEVVNPELVLGHLTDKSAEIEIDFTVERGKGYVTVEEKSNEDLAVDEISLDSLFTPIVNVSFNIEAVRVGKITNYEKLIMKVETDGTVTPKEAFSNASKILIDHLLLLHGEDYNLEEEEKIEEIVEEKPAKEKKEKKEKPTKEKKEKKSKK